LHKRPLEPKDIYNISTVGKAELSPNGKYIVYTAQRIDQEQDKSLTDIFLSETETGNIRRLTSAGQESNARFSPDGHRIAFSSGRSEKGQIFILELDGGESWKLPTQQAVADFEWGPDGKTMYYTAKVFSKSKDWVPYPGAPDYDRERLEKIANQAHLDKKEEDKKEDNVKVITAFKYRADGSGYIGDVRSHVFVTPVPDQAPLSELKPMGKQITSGDWNHNGFAASPDGKYIIVSSRHSDTPELDSKGDLWLYEIESGQKHKLYDAPGPAGNPHWSPCGRYIAYSGDDGSCGQSTTSHLWLLDISKSLNGETVITQTQEDAIPVTLPLDRPVGAYAGAELRLGGGSTMFWKGQEFYFIMTDRGVPGIYKTDIFGKVTPVFVDPNRAITSVHCANDLMIYTASSPNQLEELYLNIKGQERPVTGINDQILEDIVMGNWEYMPYNNDATALDSWVIYPTDYKPSGNYPLLLLIHGGPHGAYGPAFMFTGQLFAGKGYIVLYTNPRGSESYGQEFACCIDKNWGDRDYADIMAGVDALIARGEVDENNMFVHGWSYGGYMSCWIVTQSDRFKAICGGANVTNLLSDYGTSDITLSDEWEYGGQPWKDAAHLMKHSPISYVENVATPLMLMHGENDMRCPASQSEEFYVALKRLGKEVIMIRYPNEFHGLKRPIHRVDRYQRLLSWFQHHRHSRDVPF
jgi:dipeptidyl aminopeptidase/acylaminoacyl peptidase